MLTMKGKYGLKAMMHLAAIPAGRLTLSDEIAKANNISKKFLDAILGDLRNAGFVHARKGRNGGYALSRPPAEIRVGHILRVLDGPLAPPPTMITRLPVMLRLRRCEGLPRRGSRSV